MEIKNQRSGDSLIVCVAGRLDAVTAPDFEVHCRQAIEEGQRAMVLDFAALEYLSSAGLRSILSTAKAMTTVGGQITLANPRGVVREVFEVSGFLGMFRVIDSFDAPDHS